MRERPSKDLTVSDLLRDVMGLGQAFGGDFTGAARSVQIVDSLDAISVAHPHTVLVLTESLASSGWRVEMALRSAWERAAACVVVPHSPVHEASVGALADRLGVPMFLSHENPFQVAVRVAAAIAQPEATRAALLARVAHELAALRDPMPRQIMAVLERALPQKNIYFTGPDDGVLLGHIVTDHRMESTQLLVTDEHRLTIGTLVVQTPPDSPDSTGKIEEVLELAAAAYSLWAARTRSHDERAGVRSSLLLEQLLSGDSEDYQLLSTALGWPAGGPFLMAALGLTSASQATVDPAMVFRSFWPRRPDFSPLMRYKDVWIGWYRLKGNAPIDDDLKAFSKIVGTVVNKAANTVPCSAGVSGCFSSMAGASQAILEATTAASVAVAVAGRVVLAGQMGPEQLLATLPRQAMTQPARMVLAGLLEADVDGTLLKTLACLLDVGLAPSLAAQQLGVHRNTITARLQKIKDLGYDPGDPRQRLALHLACTVLVPGI
ncbi:CdaR family transcriptional regulator [Arthrobacter sp. AZCC_0090]|uniref:PucR family transcriptional regulator n=1 Tax=Arthrobacter sp. AZCC_0090 TaxID=2735881 RepID=UPI00161BBC00|nr:helix-turn-helix domain-containing protein [Arthrobacter sp. AZCC_0090]MBB6405992.1 hypothetical protein [Arthrobacter sp. AZCC_0090]